MTTSRRPAPRHDAKASATHEEPAGTSAVPQDSGLSITSAAGGMSRTEVHVTSAAATPTLAVTEAWPCGKRTPARAFHCLVAASAAAAAYVASAIESAIQVACS